MFFVIAERHNFAPMSAGRVGYKIGIVKLVSTNHIGSISTNFVLALAMECTYTGANTGRMLIQ